MKFLVILGFILSIFTNVVYSENLTIGIKEVKPFVYSENGKFKGISVDLINQLSKEQNFTYTFIPFKDLPTLLDNTKNGKVDMSIAAISVTYDREKYVDFSHKYFTTSLGILSKNKSGWFETTIWILKRLLIVLFFFIISLYFVGFIISKIEGDSNIVGANNGAWWALVTFSTTGYGDEVPKTSGGKLIASIWIIASLFLISIFTGYVSSILTIKKLTESPTRFSDLYDNKVIVVAGSIAQQRLNTSGVKYTSVESMYIALEKFNTGKFTAFVHDAAILNFIASSIDDVSVWNIENSEKDYAIVLPSNSILTEKINLGILKILISPEWKAIKLKYNVL